MNATKVTRVNEQMCGRCGRGMESGFPYPSCATPPAGYTREEAHRVFCTVGRDLCDDCMEGTR